MYKHTQKMYKLFVLLLFKSVKYFVLCQMLSHVVCSSGINNNISSDSFTCCDNLSGSCKLSCENLSLVQLASEAVIKESRLQNLRKYCPEIQAEFWQCMNKTLDAISQGSHWSGRSCCGMALSSRCQNGCAISSSPLDLRTFCRESDELTLFSCIDQQDKNDECCANAKTQPCMQTCQEILQRKNSTYIERQDDLFKNCKQINTDVIDCVQQNVDTTPHTNSEQLLPCCNHGPNEECKQICRSTLSSKNMTTEEIIDNLEPVCGIPLPTAPFWQCFLNGGNKVNSNDNVKEVSRINEIGMDSAKLHCCTKAYSSKCQRLCYSTYSKDWSEYRGNFQFDCLQNVDELTLRKCVDEVDNPCEVGCDGLSFCSNFNNRPTELFRNCNPAADQAAMSDVKMWQEQNILRLPGVDLPIRNISYCSPDTWRAIACILQLKPCTTSSHFNQICREDCFDILSRCMDWTKMSSESHTASSLCSKLSPENGNIPCISIKPYLEPSDIPYSGNDMKILSPCKGQTCNTSSEVCLVNRSTNKPNCVPGCPLGEASTYIVPVGQYVRIPASKTKGCYKVCQCTESGRVEKCQPLPCVHYQFCNIGSRRIEHSSWFYIECNICSCFAGEITCTKKQCKIPGISERTYTTLPCNCPPHHVPVCGKNGKTYPSSCLAKCNGLQDGELEFGSCQSRNPCDTHECPHGTMCIIDRNICLSAMHKPCPQYRCISTLNDDCQLEPVTDTNMGVHSSLCRLVQANKKLAYFGVFDENMCRSTGTVCGINGETYGSECAALSDYSMVDYNGPCKTVGLIGDDIQHRCISLKCPKKLPENCLGIIPTGACCPICGGAFKVIYSRKQIDRALYALRGKNTESLTLKAILRSLEKLVKVSQCYLSGFLTFETDIEVIVYSSHKNPTTLQIEICDQEAEKIVNLIQTKSHYISSDLGLSALTVANVVKPTIFSSSNSLRFSSILLLITFFITVR